MSNSFRIYGGTCPKANRVVAYYTEDVGTLVMVVADKMCGDVFLLLAMSACFNKIISSYCKNKCFHIVLFVI